MFVYTIEHIIGAVVVLAVIIISLVGALRTGWRQWRCQHGEYRPPATVLGSGGHGWLCQKCGKDFGWGAKPAEGDGR